MSTTVPPAPDLDLLPTDLEHDLRETLRGLLRRRCTSDAVAAVYDGDRSAVEALDAAVAVDLGLAGLLVPERFGGLGGSVLEASTVVEELGRACAPVPFLTSSVVATTLLLACDPHTASTPLKLLVAGEITAAVIVPWSSGPADVLTTVQARGRGLVGTVRSVAGALEADLLVVPVQGTAGLEVHLVDRSAVTLGPVSSLDMTRQLADVTFDAAPSAPVLQEDGVTAVRSALLTGAGLLASEQVGVARWCLQETVAYVKTRHQFGRPIGGFQALKHRLADLYAEVECASAAARHAAAALATGEDVDVAVRVAAAYCGDVAVHAAEEAVQLHGGIGMTWEHPAHLYLKKAKADQVALGTPGAHCAALADVVDLSLAEDA